MQALSATGRSRKHRSLADPLRRFDVVVKKLLEGDSHTWMVLADGASVLHDIVFLCCVFHAVRQAVPSSMLQ